MRSPIGTADRPRRGGRCLIQADDLSGDADRRQQRPERRDAPAAEIGHVFAIDAIEQ